MRNLLTTGLLLLAAAGLPALPAPPAAADPVISNGLYSRNVLYHSRFDEYGTYSDVWGYTAPDGREFAIVGVITGLSLVEITDRARPREIAFFSRPNSAWRDIKTFGTHAYDVTEGPNSGMGVIDLSDPDNPVSSVGTSHFSRAHNLYIDEATALAYVAGSDNGAGGVQIYSLVNPAAPLYVGQWQQAYAHDVFVQDGLMLVSAIQAGRLYLVDVSSPGTPVDLGNVTYPQAFTHNAGLSPDGLRAVTTDERSGSLLRFWDVSAPATPVQIGTWSANPRSIPHNAWIKGDVAYVSYYTAGIRILDVSDYSSPVEIGFYDTFPKSNVNVFDGCWGVFPYYPNSPGLFVASDISRGLYVMEYGPGLTGHGDGGTGGIGGDAADGSGRPGGGAGVSVGAPSPHPVRAGRTTVFPVTAAGDVDALLVDAAGRRVRDLRSRGGAIRWDGRDDSGRPVSTGVYFLRVAAGDAAAARRVLVVR